MRIGHSQANVICTPRGISVYGITVMGINDAVTIEFHAQDTI